MVVVVAQACDPSIWEAEGSWDCGQLGLCSEILILKSESQGYSSVVEHLPSIHKTLSSTPAPQKKKKKNERKTSSHLGSQAQRSRGRSDTQCQVMIWFGIYFRFQGSSGILSWTQERSWAKDAILGVSIGIITEQGRSEIYIEKRIWFMVCWCYYPCVPDIVLNVPQAIPWNLPITC
jgi:hypothetical protein